MLQTVDPSTGDALATYESHDDEEVARRLARAGAASVRWAGTPIEERCDLLSAVADGLEKRRAELAELMTSEMGKPIVQSESEVDKCARGCRHYADNAADYLAVEDVATEATASYVRFDPLGPILAVMPWNFPLWQVLRFAAPALAAGNVVLLKHAESVTGCAQAIERVLRDAGAPEGVFQALLIDHAATERLIGDERVRGVTLTGSVRAGREVAATAGASLKKTVLELGGSDAWVVLDDADVAAAAEVGARSRLINSGQSCIAAKRFVVHEAVADDFVAALRGRLADATLGDPSERGTDVGPLAREDLRDDLHRQVRATLNQGATAVVGADAPDRPGFYYTPTLLTGVTPEMTAGREETFGPVAAVLTAGDDDQAVAVANASSYGLGACVWTQDRDRAERLAARLDAGAVFVNDLVRSDPRMPFGGVKDSGYGRELGRQGIREWTNVKTVWVG